MQPLSYVDLGPFDARAYDPYFDDKYVETQGLERLKTAKYAIITGTKGSGKTALIKGIRNRHPNDYSHSIEVNFDEFSFTSLTESVIEIAQTSGVSDLALITNYWKYCLVVEAMKAAVGGQPSRDLDAARIRAFLKQEGHLGEELSVRMNGLADRQWERLEKATRPQRRKAEHPGLVPSEIVRDVKNYPWSSQPFAALLGHFERLLESQDDRIFITLDGLDLLQVRNWGDRSRIKVVFESLIAATYQISTSRLGQRVIVKAMVPYDVYLDLDLRDRDKYAERFGKIEWDYESLQEFLRKRITFSLDFDRAVPFERAWQEVLPNEVANHTVGVAEQSFDYILRHTLYRPRQLQVHLRTLAERYEGQLIRPEMVVTALQTSTIELVQNLTTEHKMTHPHLSEFLTHLRGKPNISAYAEMRRNVAKILNTINADYRELDSEIDALYRIGVIGLKMTAHRGVRGYQPPRRQGVAPYVCLFQHTRPNPRFTHGLRDEDEVVIHPMFYEFCQIRATDECIIG